MTPTCRRAPLFCLLPLLGLSLATFDRDLVLEDRAAPG